MKEVQSSNIEAIGYNDGTMTVRFKKGGHTYDYHGVSPQEHAELMSAESIGSHFHRHILAKYKGHKREAK